ncbi:pentapeptide repeat-containing protein [Streptomyces sp. NPDC056486]|uniref:pentapeptide repeat-containing protein n=1 Tax=Streptomyces sp. NPDC056486 TaxID=3345835 RepID=UPI003694270C
MERRETSGNNKGVIELPGTWDARRAVRVLPPADEAADALRIWSGQEDTTLDLCGLDASGVDLTGVDVAMGLFIESRLEDAVLADTDLYRADLGYAVLDRADLSRSCLVKAVLDYASLQAAVLADTNLGSAELYKTDARGACLRGACLHGALLLDTRLEGADLTGASVQGTSFKVRLDERTLVAGLTGSVYGPAYVMDNGARRELAGRELERWLQQRGATVQVLNPAPNTTTYYAKISEGYPRSHPQGIVRRSTADGLTSDHAFTRNLRWEPTEYLRLYELGHNDTDHVEISEAEAAAFITRFTKNPPP